MVSLLLIVLPYLEQPSNPEEPRFRSPGFQRQYFGESLWNVLGCRRNCGQPPHSCFSTRIVLISDRYL